MLDMCYIICTLGQPLGDCRGKSSPEISFSHFSCPFFGRCSIFVSIYGRFFDTWFFTDGFLFPIKELGFLTNIGHWIRVLDVIGSYMYIVL
jgi:hypothetical protein